MDKPTVPALSREADDPGVIAAAQARILAAYDAAENVSYRSGPDGEEMAVFSMRTRAWTWKPATVDMPLHAGDPA